MAITFTCTCGKSVQVGDEFAGREGQCPSCGQTIQIPGDGQFTEQAPPLVPRSTKAPWDELPKIEPLPEPDDDVARLVTHAGLPIDQNADFFVEAPKEIGGLYSAFTTLKTDVEPKTLAQRLMPGAFILPSALILTFMGVLLIPGQPHPEPVIALYAIAAVAALIVGGICFWRTRFCHTCSYVGAKGVVIFECAGERAGLTRSEIFLFDDAAELRIAQTRQYLNGVYAGTDYNFTWSDERGVALYHLAGRYGSEAGTPPPGDLFHLALSAEGA